MYLKFGQDKFHEVTMGFGAYRKTMLSTYPLRSVTSGVCSVSRESQKIAGLVASDGFCFLCVAYVSQLDAIDKEIYGFFVSMFHHCLHAQRLPRTYCCGSSRQDQPRMIENALVKLGGGGGLEKHKLKTYTEVVYSCAQSECQRYVDMNGSFAVRPL
jgi:hypothetical protein